MYSFREVRYIVESFLADHFRFSYVDLNEESVEKLKEICECYGRETDFMEQ